MNKLDGKSLNIVEQNIEQLKNMFPSVFSEGKINFNQLQELLGEYVIDDEDHYNFTWHGKRAAGRLAQTPSTGTLRPCKEESVDWDTTENLFIEGDNLEVLKLLQKSYHRQVKMIYIDPPYNTGHDFIYKDNFKDGVKNYLETTGQLDDNGKKFGTNSSSTGRYHTNWLNMMYPRLKLARNLLKDDGVIFISIDEGEVTNLKLICDQIFGENNFIEQVVWKNKYGSGALTKGFANIHEFVLVYSKSPIRSIAAPLNSEQRNGYKQKDEKFDLRGGYVTQPLATNSKDDRPNLVFPILHEGIEIWPDKQWIWSRDRVEKAQKNNELIINEKDGKFSVRMKQYLRDNNGKERMGKPTSIMVGPFNQEGTKEIKSLFKKSIFDFPKPSEFIKHFFSFVVNGNEETDGLYLDFFAGSSSSAHAVMKLNASDNGKRKFLMVQLPEPTNEKSVGNKEGYENIATISIDRIKKAASKTISENPGYEGDLGFKIFKLDTSNIKRWEVGFDSLETDLVDAVNYLVEGRSDDDVLYELCLKLGLDLSIKVDEKIVAGKKVLILGRGYLVVCLDDKITVELADGIGALKEELTPEDGMRIVFKDEGFRDDVVKTNTLQTLKRYGIEDVKSL